MPSDRSDFVAIALLLAQAKTLDQATIQRAAEFAFHGAPAKPMVMPIPGKPIHAVGLGPLRMGVISVATPYFKDVATAANRTPDVTGRMAVLQHTAWLSVDVAGQSPVDPKIAFGLIGQLVAEFCDDTVLGLIRLPRGPVIGYDFSFIPLLRARKAEEIFSRGRPDRIVKASASNQALAAAAEEARRRFPEFVAAFSARRRGDGFGVKKAFKADGVVEHMWIDVSEIDGMSVRGLLANEPASIKSLKLKDRVEAELDEIEDWLFMRGKEQVGGFQAKVLRK